MLIKSFKTTDIDYLVILYIQSSRHNLRCFLSMLDLPILQVLGYGDEIIKKTGSNIHMRLEKHMRDPQNRFFTRIGIISKWPNGFFFRGSPMTLETFGNHLESQRVSKSPRIESEIIKRPTLLGSSHVSSTPLKKFTLVMFR